MKKRTSLPFITGIIALAVLGLGWQQHTASAGQPRFITASIDRANIKQFASTSGTLNPVKLVNVGTQITGLVKTLHVDFNSVVKEGDVLAELDPSLLNAQLVQAKGSLSAAQAALIQSAANYQRQKALFTKGYGNKADYEKAQAAYGSDTAQVDAAKGQVQFIETQLGFTVIRSPISGVIINRQTDVGQTVTPNYQMPPLFTIAQDLRKMEIDSNLSEADVGSVREGMPVEFTVDAFPGRRYAGKVRQIRLNPTNVQNVVTYNVVIDVDNPDLSLLPGMTTFAVLIEAEHKSVLRVPNSALAFKLTGRKADSVVHAEGTDVSGSEQPSAKEQIHGIYTMKDGQIFRVILKTGISDGKYTEVLGDALHEGEEVITDDLEPVKKANSKPGSIGGV